MLEPALPLSRLGKLGLRVRDFWCMAAPLEIMAILRMPDCRLLGAAIPCRWAPRDELGTVSDSLDSGSDSCSSISGRVVSSKLGLDFEASLPRRRV